MAAFAVPRSPTGFLLPLGPRCPRRRRSPPTQIRPLPAAPISPPAPPPRASPRFRPSRRRRGSWIRSQLFSLCPSASVAAILAATRLLQRSSKFFRRVLAEFLFQCRGRDEFCAVTLHERGLERLMPPERIEKHEKTRLVARDKEAHQPFRFVVERLHSIRRRIRHRHQLRQRNQFLFVDRLRMRLRIVIARALITGPRTFRNILRKPFVQPARDSIRVVTMNNEMRNFVSENVAAEFVGWIAQNEEAPSRLNPAGPRLELSGALKLLPVSRPLENINVRFRVAGELLALKLLHHHPVCVIRIHRERRHDKAVDEMIDEMLGLAVLPLFRIDRERLLAERSGIALAQAREFHLGQGVEAWRRRRRLRKSRRAD